MIDRPYSGWRAKGGGLAEKPRDTRGDWHKKKGASNVMENKQAAHMQKTRTGNADKLYFSERLSAMLVGMLTARTTIISAPAGYGKTTVSRFRRQALSRYLLTAKNRRNNVALSRRTNGQPPTRLTL